MSDKGEKLPNFPGGSGPKKWDPEDLAKEEAHVQETLLSNYRGAFEAKGLSAERLAALRMQQLVAKSIKMVKIKGVLPKQLNLPRGYKVITPTERITIRDPKTGIELVADPGETIIQYSGPDWGTREKAMNAIETIMGYRSEEQQGGNGQTIIIMQSMIPLPGPAPTPEALAYIQNGTDDKD